MRPVPIAVRTVRETERALRVVYSSISKILAIRYQMSAKSLCDEMAIEPWMMRLLNLAPRDWRWRPMARPDFIETSQGLKLIELNVGSAVGFVEHCGLWWRLYCGTPFGAGFYAADARVNPNCIRTLYDTLLELYHEFFGGQADQPFVVVGMARAAAGGPERNARALERLFRAEGLPCRMAFSDQLTLDDRVLLGDTPVDIYLNNMLGIHRDTWKNVHLPWLAGKLLFFAGYVEYLFENKRWLALLSDTDQLPYLSDDERRVLDSTVVWTRVVEEGRTRRHGRIVDLIPHVAATKDDFVLKPAFGCCGINVLIGAELSDTAWRSRLNDCLTDGADPWIVQEYLPLPEVRLPFLCEGRVRFRKCATDVSLFLLNGRLPFGIRRLKAQGTKNEKITNSGQGGATTWLPYA
jgi:hypothetical protein